jgi:uncharacterized membrane protein (DUF485 family)
MRHLEKRHHFLREHIEKGDIEMRYIDTKRQLAGIFTKPLDASRFDALQGGLVFSIPMSWFEGEFVFYLVYLYLFGFLSHFLHTHLSYLASTIILACICMIMPVIVLG